MNNRLATAKHLAYAFGVCENFKRQSYGDNGDSRYYDYDGNDDVLRTRTYIGKCTVTKWDFVGYHLEELSSSHQSLSNKLLPVVRHYAQCYGVNYYNNVVYVTFLEMSLHIWRFDGAKYMKMMFFHSCQFLKYIKSDSINTTTLYIMKT